MSEDVSFIKTIKNETLNESDLSEEQKQAVNKMDEETFKIWKKNVIHKFNNFLPSYLNLVKVKNWDEAMRLLTKTIKKKKLE